MATELEREMQETIQALSGESGISPPPGTKDKLKWYLDEIQRILEEGGGTGGGGGGGTGGVSSVNNRTGAVTLDKTDVGLGNVNDTADTDKPVSTAQQAAIDAEAQARAAADNNLQNNKQDNLSPEQTAVVNADPFNAAQYSTTAEMTAAIQAALDAADVKGVIKFKGYISLTAPPSPETGDLWAPFTRPPTPNFSAVTAPSGDQNAGMKKWNGSAWEITPYTPEIFHLWSDLNDGGKGFYIFPLDTWNNLDFSIDISALMAQIEQWVLDKLNDYQVKLTQEQTDAINSGITSAILSALAALPSYFTNGVANIAAKLNTAKTIDSNLNNTAAVTATPGFDGSGNILLNNTITVAAPSGMANQLTGATYSIKVIIQRILDNLAYLFSASGSSGALPVANGGTGLSTIPAYHLLAATAANTLKPYKKGGLGVMSQVSFARPYKQFTHIINRPGFDNMGDVGKAQVEFIGKMKLYTDGSTESVAGKIKIRWAELIFSSGGNIDLSGQVILSPTALIKSFLPAICDNSVGYNSPTLVNEGAEGVCGKITACNHNGVKYNIYGGALLQYDSTNGLTAVGTIVTTDVATLMYEMEFPIAAMWTSTESAFWGNIA